MTELEKRLAEALRTLSEQYEREQERQAGRIGRLGRQVQQLSEQVGVLSGHVERLAADYRRIADALSGF